MATARQPLEDFLQPLRIDIPKIHSLTRAFCTTFARLALQSTDQFLPTPISDSVLRPEKEEKGRYLAIDIGGTNLRVGFIELGGSAGFSEFKDDNARNGERSRVRRLLEKSWPIGEKLKRNKPENLFTWIGKCITEVVRDGCDAWPGYLQEPIPLGVTFSFPIIQQTLADATLMSMGKGFAITRNLDLAKQLLIGYESCRPSNLPKIKIVAICNDSSATFVSFVYQKNHPRRKAAMGLIVGTGCNATIPLALSKLHPSKRVKAIKVFEGGEPDLGMKITVNTEWTIKGAAGPLRELHLITHWDKVLDSEVEVPGFQPFEYMTAGRYLGELGRIIAVDYFTNHLGILETSLPPRLRERNGLTTTFLGNLGPHLAKAKTESSVLNQLNFELPPALDPDPNSWKWTAETAEILFRIAKAVQIRAAGLLAAAVIGLLASADEIHLSNSLTNGKAPSTAKRNQDTDELMVGYTGGCIVHFQDYLQDCQQFLDAIMQREFGESRLRVVLHPCHDGGIIGAGILAGTAQSMRHGV